MRSIRLDDELEARLAHAAAVRGESLSEFIRQAVADRADATLIAEPDADFDDVVGAIHGGSGRARYTGAAFTESLVERSTQA